MTQTTTSDRPIRIAFIEAGWHRDIVARSREGFVEEISASGDGIAEVTLFEVPGSYDIPLLAAKIAQTGAYDAIVAAGFVVDGGIYRHDFVAGTVIDALMRVQLESGVPVISAVLAPHQFQETPAHIRFFRDHFVVKGQEAARAALHIVRNLHALDRQSTSEPIEAVRSCV